MMDFKKLLNKNNSLEYEDGIDPKFDVPEFLASSNKEGILFGETDFSFGEYRFGLILNKNAINYQHSELVEIYFCLINYDLEPSDLDIYVTSLDKKTTYLKVNVINEYQEDKQIFKFKLKVPSYEVKSDGFIELGIKIKESSSFIINPFTLELDISNKLNIKEDVKEYSYEGIDYSSYDNFLGEDEYKFKISKFNKHGDCSSHSFISLEWEDKEIADSTDICVLLAPKAKLIENGLFAEVYMCVVAYSEPPIPLMIEVNSSFNESCYLNRVLNLTKDDQNGYFMDSFKFKIPLRELELDDNFLELKDVLISSIPTFGYGVKHLDFAEEKFDIFTNLKFIK